MKRRGTTLLELIVASGVLLVMVFMTTSAVVSYGRAYHQYTDKGLRVRQAAKVLEVVCQHLRSADSIPLLEHELSCSDKPLVFSERNAGQRALFLNSKGVLDLQELDADLKVKSFTAVGKVRGLTCSENREGGERRLHLTLQVEDSQPLESAMEEIRLIGQSSRKLPDRPWRRSGG